MRFGLVILSACMLLASCHKNSSSGGSTPPPTPKNFNLATWNVNGVEANADNMNTNVKATIRLKFNAALDRSSVAANISLAENSGNPVLYNPTYESGDSVVVVHPVNTLAYLSKYKLNILSSLKNTTGGILLNPTEIRLTTSIDSSRKFPIISDDSLLTLVQKQTFRYFWDFAHPVSGLARERNTSGETVTSGGSGFGIMAIVTGVNRGFVTRAQGLARMQTIISFLKNTAKKFHGAFPHWLNGTTGAVVPFSTKDNGADLVETSFLVSGLLTARQYFNGAGTDETTLRNDINALVDGVEWNWFRKSNENVLYWHWSPDYNWDMNLPIRGWNECLITYILAASSNTFTIPKEVYTQGWTANGSNGFTNGNSYMGFQLPLGTAYGGPLFFSHYSFLGINPNGLADVYADYQKQVVNHSKINAEYCRQNPGAFFGYSDSCWGLTASDIPNGYTASSPTNDVGTIAPTAAVSSLPFTPTESMKALKFFYYVLGDKLWGNYGFKDAFSLKDVWFADSYLAIDQGPMIVMIENYRSGLLWNLLTSCPEVKTGMKKLGFAAPYLP